MLAFVVGSALLQKIEDEGKTATTVGGWISISLVGEEPIDKDHLLHIKNKGNTESTTRARTAIAGTPSLVSVKVAPESSITMLTLSLIFTFRWQKHESNGAGFSVPHGKFGRPELGSIPQKTNLGGPLKFGPPCCLTKSAPQQVRPVGLDLHCHLYPPVSSFGKVRNLSLVLGVGTRWVSSVFVCHQSLQIISVVSCFGHNHPSIMVNLLVTRQVVFISHRAGSFVSLGKVAFISSQLCSFERFRLRSLNRFGSLRPSIHSSLLWQTQ